MIWPRLSWEFIIYTQQWGLNTYHIYKLSWISRGFHRQAVSMGWINRFHLLMEGWKQQVILPRAVKEDDRILWPFCNALSRTSWAEFKEKEISSTCSLMIPGIIVISGATREKERLPCYPLSSSWLHIFRPPSTINELTMLLFKTSSSNSSLRHITCHLFEDVGSANYSFSNPNNSTTTFIQEKPLSHLSIWSA